MVDEDIDSSPGFMFYNGQSQQWGAKCFGWEAAKGKIVNDFEKIKHKLH